MEKDLLDLLSTDHAALGRLAGRMALAPSPGARRAVFPELASFLAAHQTVVDRTVLPALKALGWHGIRSDLLESHVALERALAEAVALDREGGDADGEIRSLARRVARQCATERDTLLPVLASGFDAHQRELLALDAEQHLTRLLGEPHRVPDDAALIGPHAADLLDEAYVVLSSLPVDGRLSRPRP